MFVDHAVLSAVYHVPYGYMVSCIPAFLTKSLNTKW